jgi:hypothetical protein
VAGYKGKNGSLEDSPLIKGLEPGRAEVAAAEADRPSPNAE